MTSNSKRIIIKASFLERHHSGTGTVGGANCPRVFLRGGRGNLDYERYLRGQFADDCPRISSIHCTKQDRRAGYIDSIYCAKQKNLTGIVGTVLENKFLWNCPHYPRENFVDRIYTCRIAGSTIKKYPIDNGRKAGIVLEQLSPRQNPLFLVTVSIDLCPAKEKLKVYTNEEKRGQLFLTVPADIPYLWGYRRPVK